MPKETGEKLIVQNKKARHDYAIEDKYEAGLALTGTEVKSLREGRASLSEAFISIDRRGEMWLEGAKPPIPPRKCSAVSTAWASPAGSACSM